MPASGRRPKPSVPAALPEPEADFSSLTGLAHVALAVSGGSDSTALMCLIHEWSRAQLPPPRVSVLTVDHGLREESAFEAARVAAWAQTLGFVHHTLIWREPKPKTGLQAKARAARYGLMTEWCRAERADMLATAHTLDDQAETVLMRLRRTYSPESLAGIPRMGQWQGIPMCRPLLGLRRGALRQFLQSRGQGWIEDPSNRNPGFERVRVRAALAGLEGHGVTAKRLAALAESCERTSSLLERCARRWIGETLSEHEAGFCQLPPAALAALPQALQERILLKIVMHYGGGHMRPEPAELRRLTQWMKEGSSRCTLGGAIIGRRKDRVWVAREAARIDRLPLTVGPSGTAIWDGRFAITAPQGSAITACFTDPPELGEGVPVFARKAYPKVSVPEGVQGPAAIRFLNLRGF